MKSYPILIGFLLLLFSASAFAATADKADCVDLFMGVKNMSHCVIGPQLPHGSVNPSPQTPDGGHAGYKEHQPIRGFGQLHVSGIGWGRYGQIFISPQIGFKSGETQHDSPKSDEVATPYYYKVNLDRYGIKAEITPSYHSVYYRFTYPEKGDKNLLVDVRHNIPQDIVPIVKGKFLGGEVDYDAASSMLTGWGEYAGGFGSERPYKVYFAMQLDVKPTAVKITDKGVNALFARIALPSDASEVNLRVGISLKSVAGACRYLSTEIGMSSFDEVKAAAKATWNETLGKIDIGGASETEQRLFYTAMYHSYVMPRDRSGDNPRWTSGEPHFDDHYCVWDTWRTKYPLMALIEESFVARSIRSFIDRFEHDGECTPTFTSSLEWEKKQGGDDVDNIIADAFAKGVTGFDREKAYALIKHNAFKERDSLYQKYGWIPDEGQIMGCSASMEYAYNDACGAWVAAQMGDSAVAAALEKRSQGWANLFNPSLESNGFNGFVGPRRPDGTWIPIDPAKRYGSWVEYFYEGNSWVYTLFVPHQMERLIRLCGGREAMVERLKYGFDHRLIELDNEPGFLSPFIFSHCDRPDLAAKYVDYIRQNRFSLSEGYPENEDSGAMGAWYVFASIGFFPNAGQDYYYLLPPAFPQITVTMENGKKIEIKTVKSSPDACYIESVELNGKRLDRTWVRHGEIAEGAVLVYRLTNDPARWQVRPFEVSRSATHPFGVNLAGAEFFHHKMEGVGRFNKDYFYPSAEEFDYWKSKNLMLIRLPFKWERIQRKLGGDLLREEIDYIKYLLEEADKRGMKILLDMHNYGRRKDDGKDRIIGDSLSIADFGEAWSRISKELKDCKGLYGYGLINEPHDMLKNVPWKEIAQAAIDSIRKNDTATAIVVGGDFWSSAERWLQMSDDLKSLNDPSHNLIFEAHCYFDEDGSGIYRRSYDEEKAYPFVGVDRVRPFVEWLQRNNLRGMVGEFGVPGNDPRWLVCLDNFLRYLSENGVNGTYWAAGTRWNNYILSVQPDKTYSVDKPQMQILTKYPNTEKQTIK